MKEGTRIVHPAGWRTAMAAASLVAMVDRSEAGPYAGALDDPTSLYDAGIPGFVGPDGRGRIGAADTNNFVNPAFVAWASEVVDYAPAPGVAAQWTNATQTLGPVTGNNFHIASLGDINAAQIASNVPPGSITLKLGRLAMDGPGADLAVFENGFLSGNIFGELGYLEVSSDGLHFARFPSDSLTPAPVGAYGVFDASDVFGLCGKHVNAYGNSWGTPFDLSALAADPDVLNGVVDLNHIEYVRIVDVPGSGDFLDVDGDPIYDAWVTWGSGGVDLEAVGVLNAANLINTVAPRPWSQFHGDETHLSTWPGSVDPSAVSLRWASSNGFLRASQPAVSEDGERVFAYGDLTHPEGFILALDAADGSLVWSNAVRSHVSFWSWSSPIYHRGYVYWAGGPDPFMVTKIRASDGSTNAVDGAWSVRLAGDIVNATPTIAGDLLYISTYGGFSPSAARHYALDIADGSVAWSNQDGGQGQGAMAVDPDRGLVYQTIYVNNEHRLRAYDALDGTVVWTADWAMGVPPYGAPFQCAIGYWNGLIYIQDYDFGGDGNLHVADAGNAGDRLWSAPTPVSGDSCPAIDYLGGTYAFGDYTGSGQTRAYDLFGNTRWTSALGGGWQACPAWANGYVFVGDQLTTDLYLLNDEDGSQALRVDGSGPVAFGNNAFYSVGNDGVLYAYVADALVLSNVYEVTVNSSGEGTVGPAASLQVAEGANPYFGFEAADGSVLAEVLVNGASVGTPGSYRFADVAGNQSLEVVFEPYQFPIIEANGSGNPLTVSAGEPVLVTITYHAGAYEGYRADSWILLSNPAQEWWYSYDAWIASWMPWFQVSYQGPLQSLRRFEVMNYAGLPPGEYVFYFGLDAIVDGVLQLDQAVFDAVEVTVLP